MASVTIASAERDGDGVLVRGTVDGKAVQAQVWKSHLDTLGTRALKVQYCAQQLKAAADLDAPKPTVDLAATVTV